MRRPRILITSILGSACFLALNVLTVIEPFAYTRVRNLYRDTIVRAGRTTPPNPNLVFLAIDADSVNLDDKIDIQQMYGLDPAHPLEARALQLMTQHWPWPREVYALIVKRLVDAGAKVVAFDLTFPTPTDGDEPFQLALDRYRDHVVIGSNFVDPSWNGSSKSGASLTRPPQSLIPQTAPMDDRIGYTNFWPDADDVVRRAQYRVTFEQVEDREAESNSEEFVALGARALSKAGFDRAVPADVDAHMFRFTALPRVGFPAHSIFEIFVPEYWRHNYRDGAFFQDKIVIVGAEGNWQHDEHQTPFGSMPGPELHLNAMNAAVHGEFIKETSPRDVVALTALAGIIAVALSRFVRSPWTRLGALIAIDGLNFWVALCAFNRANIFIPLVAPFIQLNFTILLGLVSDFAGEQIEKTRLRRTFERYVSRDVVKQMIDNPKRYAESLGGVVRPVTVLFSDIRGYSLVSARSDPHLLVTQLNEYLTAMVECVFRFGGTLDKFIGDALMAVWGNVQSDGPREDAVNAVRAALAMRAELALLNKKWHVRGLSEFRVGTAINHGEVVVGNIGSPHRMEFTVIGDAVNVSWKLQELTKELGHDLIVGPQVRDLVVEYFDLRAIGPVEIPGWQSSLEVFGVTGPVEITSARRVTI